MQTLQGLLPLKGESKKTGKPYDGFLLNYTEDYTRDGVGLECNQVFVDRSILHDALAGRKLDEVIGSDCTVVYNRSGFPVGLTID